VANPFEDFQDWIIESETSLRARRDRSVVDLMYQGFRLVEDVLDDRYVPEVLSVTVGDIDSEASTDGQVITSDGAGNAAWETKVSQVALTIYDAQPARSSEGNYHGGIQSLATAQTLNSTTPINLSKGTGKVLIVINDAAPSGGLTITGPTIDRETGVKTDPDTNDITIDAQTTDTSSLDSNNNVVHGFSGAYISSNWFTGAIAISTADLNLTDVDVYHVSFEQFNDTASYTIQTFDASLWTEHANAEFSGYLYSLTVSGSKCEIVREASLNLGLDGEAPIADRYWRLRSGNIGKVMDGSTDGMWIDCFYSNSPVYVEDVTIKVWADMVL